MDRFNYLGNLDNSVIESMFEQFKQDPSSVEESWRQFFEGYEFCQVNYKAEKGDAFLVPNEFKVINLINGYRSRGHLFTKTNPVRTRRTYTPTLAPENFGLAAADMNKVFQAGKEIGIGNAKLSDIIARLEQTYCQSVGAEFYYIRKPEQVNWLRDKMEGNANTPAFSTEKKTFILENLAKAVLFEKFIHKKFPGHKSFSLEGVESLIPALASVIDQGSALGIEEFMIGMAHRGRLNVLTSILNKPASQVFSEFEGNEYEDEDILGDVKYHLGYSTTVESSAGKSVKLSLAPNPSHLEAVDPVVEGLVRARIDGTYGGDNSRIAPILVHGDASVAGQGIIYEVLQMSELQGYRTGGTIHLVVNNQLGFTTNYLDGRSSTYCTDVAKTLQSPVFHVNADDVEAVVYTVLLAMEFRQEFRKDVFIDLLGYRKYGHNEGDEPRFTQPLLYKAIEQHDDPLEIYVKKLESEGTLVSIDLAGIRSRILQGLENAFDTSRTIEKATMRLFLEETWKNFEKPCNGEMESSPDTGVSRDILLRIAERLTTLPEGVPFFKKIQKLQADRREMIEKDGFDWAMGELLAYGSLVMEHHPVRISGQDVQRGTFSHRHSVLTVEDSEDKYIPLEHISEGQSPFYIYNSLLSEYGVLGFEYGYALAAPESLVIWEAQFGDFSNGAQVIIDQYISSAEDKWRLMNGIVMYLPHGYEGQGPEHSSARLERFLNLCGHDNMQIANITTPANLFHALRRQMARPFRKPLVVFTPKSLLRNPACVSALADFEQGGFREVIDDNSDPSKVEKVIFCTGKVYYDLAEEKARQQKDQIAIIRIEQLYPLPEKQITAILDKYGKAKMLEWIQEEPVNMGAWKFISQNFPETGKMLYHTTRPASGSPATGSSKLHKIQQRILVEKAMGQCTCEHAYGSCRLHCTDSEMVLSHKK